MITDPDRVERVVAVVDRQQTGWRLPWSGSPEGALEFRLFSEENLVGGFEMGPGFLVTFADGGFYSRTISPGDQQELIDALGITGRDIE